MKTLLQLVEEWRLQAASLSMGRLGGPLAARKLECANELEAWVRELAGELDKAEADQQAGRVGSLGPLYDTGINVGRATIRGLLGVK